jgi:hypothetical protein
MADFSPGALADAVHATLDDAYAAIPPGKTHAFLLDATLQDRSARVMYVQKVGDGWNLAGKVEWHVGDKQPTAGVALLRAW